MKTFLRRVLYTKFAIFSLMFIGASLLVYKLNIAQASTGVTNDKQVIVRYRTTAPLGTPSGASTLSVESKDVVSELKNLGADVTKVYANIPAIAIITNDATLPYIRTLSGVEAVENDDQSLAKLNNVITTTGTSIPFTAGYDGNGQYVAVLDSGFRTDHIMLSGQVVDESCYSGVGGIPQAIALGYVTDCPNGQPSQTGSGASAYCTFNTTTCPHGTHVAGIVAGNAVVDGGGHTLSGIGKGSKLILSNVFTRIQTTPGVNAPNDDITSFDSDQLAALDHIISLAQTPTYSGKIAAVNMSIGGAASFSSNCDATKATYKSTVDTLRSLGIATIIASGNDGSSTNISAPSCLSNVITIGSTDYVTDTVSCFSNSNSLVELVAPGSGQINPACDALITPIMSAGVSSSTALSGEVGTSMAAPVVAGAWATLKERAPGASVSAILAVLQSTGHTVIDARNGLSFKRVDIGAAFTALDATRKWDGGGTTDNWSDAANWTLDIVPGTHDTVVLDATSTKNMVIDTDIEVKSLQVTSAYTGTITNNNKNVGALAGGVIFAGTGSLALGNGTYTVVGNWSTAGQQSEITGSPILHIYNVATAVATGIETYANVETNSSANITLTGTLKISGNLVSAGTLNVGSSTIELGGNFTNTGTFNAGTGTIKLMGTTQTLTGSTTFNSLEKSKSNGTLTLTAGNTFTVQNLKLTGISKAKKLTVNTTTGGSSATFTYGGSGSTTNLIYLAMKDITFSGYSADPEAGNSTDNGNNVHVSFVALPGVSIVESGDMTSVTEGASSDILTVELDKVPSSNVTVTMTGGSELSVTPSSICFGATANSGCGAWNMPVTVTVNAVDDILVQGNRYTAVNYSTASSDTNYNAMDVAPTTIQIIDNDSACNATTDSDCDGVSNSDENAAPNTGDANGDGVKDMLQPNVATVPSATTNKPVTLSVTAPSCMPHITQYTSVKETSFKENTTYDFPLGLSSFHVDKGSCANGFTSTVKIIYDKDYSDAKTVAKFIGSTTAASISTDITSQSTLTKQSIGGKTVTTVSYNLTDGGVLDEDGVADGTLVDPSGLAADQGKTFGALLNTGSPIMLNAVIGAVIIGFAIYLSTKSYTNALQGVGGPSPKASRLPTLGSARTHAEAKTDVNNVPAHPAVQRDARIYSVVNAMREFDRYNKNPERTYKGRFVDM